MTGSLITSFVIGQIGIPIGIDIRCEFAPISLYVV